MDSTIIEAPRKFKCTPHLNQSANIDADLGVWTLKAKTIYFTTLFKLLVTWGTSKPEGNSTMN